MLRRLLATRARRDPPPVPPPDTGDSLLLLRAAALEGPAAHAAWHAWRTAGGNLDTVASSSFSLLPLVYRNLESAGVEDPDLPVLAGVYRHAFVSNQRLLGPGAAALDALTGEGLATMLLGGAAVGAVHYRDAACRPLDTVDVLVRGGDAERARSALSACGWRERERVPHAPGCRPLEHVNGGTLALWSRVPLPGAAGHDVWAAAATAAFAGTATAAPDPTDQLLHACAPSLRPGTPVLQTIADAAVILRGASGEIAWARLTAAASEQRLTAGALSVLRLLHDSLDAPVPGGVLAELRAGRSGATRAPGVQPRP